MDCRPPLLGRLRRSLLGAWLACAYGLAVLAGVLASASAQAHGPADGVLLCSGLAVPGQKAPDADGEPGHCKICPLVPALAAPAATAGFAVLRLPVRQASLEFAGEVQPYAARFGLPQSRGPPAV